MPVDVSRRVLLRTGALLIPTALISPSVLLSEACVVAKVIGTVASAMSILEYLGIRPSFSKSVDYREGSQCTSNFQKDEEAMRHRKMEVFIGVNRSPYLSDVAVMVSAAANKQRARSELSIQYQSGRSIAVYGPELDASRVAADFVAKQYEQSGANLVRAITFTGRKVLHVNDKETGETVPITQISTASDGYILFNPKPKGRFSQYDVGTVAIFQPGFTEPNDLPIIGLQS